jgi:Tfp pilus assembly protein PilN
VSRTDTLWLTSVDRKGNALTINGSAGSINAVANYITQLKRSGYFQQVEIKESHQDDSNKAVQIFLFTLDRSVRSAAIRQAAPMPRPTRSGRTGKAAPAANTAGGWQVGNT